MIPNSLRFRLIGAATLVILIALQVAGGALLVVFERNLTRQVDLELVASFEQLATHIKSAGNGEIELVNEPADPRFRQPLAGRYWMIMSGGKIILRSRSLWDADLIVGPAPLAKDGARFQRIAGPDKQQLYGAVRTIILEPETPDDREIELVIVTAMDLAEVDELKRHFQDDVVMALGCLAFLLIAATWVQVKVGLQPLEALRSGLARIREGDIRRLSADVPKEVEPLVAETNRLLDEQDRAIEKARSRAGDLAHGLKTPLTALTILAQHLREEGRSQSAEEIDIHLKSLTTHVERELARSRIAARAGVSRRAQLKPLLARVVHTISRLPKSADLDWSVQCPQFVTAIIDETDLAEVLGNVLDNARKWAANRVSVEVAVTNSIVSMVVSDDGPGIAESNHASVLRRGIRLDESKPGHGLGFSIANEIVEAYRGEIALAKSCWGGLAVQITLPAA